MSEQRAVTCDWCERPATNTAKIDAVVWGTPNRITVRACAIHAHRIAERILDPAAADRVETGEQP